MDESRIKQAAEAEPGEILRVRREKLAALQEAGKDPFTVTRYGQTHHARQIVDGFESHESKPVCVAGRLMSKRVMGKMSFAHLLDEQGQIQLVLKRDVLGEEAYGAFKALDIGDIVGAEGAVFRTNAGEVSVLAERVQLLSKSLLPLPEKFHGLKDNDLRYRQRYVDLMVNPEVRAAFVKRSRVISAMRRFLDGLGFLEVETPVLNTIIGGASARPFITHHNTLDIDMYMRIALELHLKRLVVGGFERVYEIGRVFRNEGMSTRHNPEFTIMELYQAYTDYNGMMELTESIFAHCAGEVLGTLQISYQGEPIDLTPPFRRLSMNDAVKEAVGADFAACADDMQARALAESLKLDVKKTDTKGKLLSLAFEEFAEHKLIQPTFVTDHPVDISPLAKRRQDAPWLTERFELFIYGREHANAFSELNDPIDQRQRFEQQARQRAAGDEEAQMMDEDFVTALEYGLPPTGGLGIGVDRMVMLLTDAASIRDVLLFPTMKPLGK